MRTVRGSDCETIEEVTNVVSNMQVTKLSGLNLGTGVDDAKAVKKAATREMRVVRYEPEYARVWNDFLSTAVNSTFLFDRGFMEYHADRFVDCSLLVFDGDSLIALLPANIAGDRLVSHGGLTYGGLLVRWGADLQEIANALGGVLRWCEDEGIRTLIYKRLPRIYSRSLDDEIDYLLFVLDARLFRRELSVAVDLGPNALPYRSGRRSSVATAARRGCDVERTDDLRPFWTNVLTPVLEQRHGATPVHSVEEIMLLARRFPENIRQFNVMHGDEIVAGATLFVTERVAHTQYLAVSEEGRRLRALDLLVDYLLRNEFSNKRYFDFGTSSLDEGKAMNSGLHFWKEGFGARGVCHDFYELDTSRSAALDVSLR